MTLYTVYNAYKTDQAPHTPFVAEEIYRNLVCSLDAMCAGKRTSLFFP